MEKITLNVSKREGVGKNSVDKLRVEKQIPGILYGKDLESTPIQAVEKDIMKVAAEAGTSTLVDLNVDGDVKKILFKEIQMHPFKNQILHFDAYAVNMNEKIRLSIPVVLHNRDEITAQPSVLLQHLDEVEVECLPGSLPSAAEVDVENLQIGDVVVVADLDVSSIEGIDVLSDPEEAVCSLQEPREEAPEVDEDEEAEEDAADVPTVDETEAEENEEE